jgi:uncharacterized protein
MKDRIAGFDWDDGNTIKCQKHGVAIEEIEAVLVNRTPVAPDFKHSDEEQRFIVVERNRSGRPMFIAFTFREREGQTLIRPVSARYMRKEEIEKYEKSSSTAH